MINYPNKLPVLTEAEIQVGQPTSEETIRKAIQMCNFFSRILPIGSVIPVDTTVNMLPSIRGDLYHPCDGSEITDPNSPIATRVPTTRTAPQLDAKHIRGAITTTANNDLGTASIDITHNHGGFTGGVTDNPFQNVASRTNARDANHKHRITAYTLTVPLDPFHRNIRFYIKIN